MRARTLTRALQLSSASHADLIALRMGSRGISYAEFDALVAHVANAMRMNGVRNGDHVAALLPNSPDVLVCSCATWRAGAAHVGIDPRSAPAEVERLLELLQPALLVTDGGQRDERPLRGWGSPVAVSIRGRRLLLRRRGASPPRERRRVPRSVDKAVILITSGTSGASKCVVRRHGELARGWSRMATRLDAMPGDAHLAQLPLSHGFGFGLALVALLSGGRLVFPETQSSEDILRVVEREGVAFVHGTPTHYMSLLDHLAECRHDISTVRAGWGSAAGFSGELSRRIINELGVRLVVGYGSSEGLGWATDDPDDLMRGSVGRPPSGRVRIRGRGGRNGPQVTGEIELRKTHPVEYLTSGAAATATSPSGWHATGDRGYIDADGRLFVIGRIAPEINRGGLGVDPLELESVLMRHPSLSDVAVAGVPHRTLGEAICACVVPNVDAKPALNDLREFCRASVAEYKLPDSAIVMSAIPRTSIGKVDRAAVRTFAVSAQNTPHMEEGTIVEPDGGARPRHGHLRIDLADARTPSEIAAASRRAAMNASRSRPIVRRCEEVEHGLGLDHLHVYVAHAREGNRASNRAGGVVGTGVAYDASAARLAAVAEVVERSAAITPPHQHALVRRRSAALNGDALPIDAFRGLSDGQYRRLRGYEPLTSEKVIDWCSAFSLTRDGAVLIPACHAYQLRRDEVNNYLPELTTTGVACHVSVPSAVLAGLCEVLERDALAIAWYERLPLRSVDVTGTALRDRVATVMELGIRMQVFAIPTDHGVPVALAMASRERGWPYAAVGAGCRPQLSDAAERAVLEALQVLSGVPRAPVPRLSSIRTFEDHALYYASQQGAAVLRSALRLTGEPWLLAGQPESSTEPEREVRRIVELLSRLGLEVVVVDLTTDEIAATGYRVLRVIVPGAVDISADPRAARFGSARLRSVATALGSGTSKHRSATSRLPVPLA